MRCLYKTGTSLWAISKTGRRSILWLSQKLSADAFGAISLLPPTSHASEHCFILCGKPMKMSLLEKPNLIKMRLKRISNEENVRSLRSLFKKQLVIRKWVRICCFFFVPSSVVCWLVISSNKIHVLFGEFPGSRLVECEN